MCTAWTARSRSSRRVTTERRISEVEIKSILMPALESAENRRADTPGFVRMPTPISDSLPMSGL